jgi:hypothetical protein
VGVIELIGPIVRKNFTWLMGRQYHASETDRSRLVSQIPLCSDRDGERSYLLLAAETNRTLEMAFWIARDQPANSLSKPLHL